MKQRAVIKAIDNDEYIAMLPQIPKRKSEKRKAKKQLATRNNARLNKTRVCSDTIGHANGHR
jgi:hypothetical protein